MRVFELTMAHHLPRPPEQVFSFFSDAGNLAAMAPPWIGFHVLTPLSIVLRQGTRLDYRLRLRGIPLRWRTEITDWEPPHRFVDEQLRGPYRLWVHEHTFEAVEGGTRARDRVRYAVPGGALVNRLLVARDLKQAFAYRGRKLCEIFGAGSREEEPLRIGRLPGISAGQP